MFLIEDLSQSNDVAVPYLEIALLLDFADPSSWGSIETIMSLLNPSKPLDFPLLRKTNVLRLEKTAILRFQCPNPKCLHPYHVHLWMGPRFDRRIGIPNPPKRFSIKCSVCRSPVNLKLLDSPSGPPDWTTRTWLPRAGRLPLMHISRLV